MPLFNIELRNAERVWETVQHEADDHTKLRIEVARFLRELMKDHAQQIWIDQEWRVDVTDQDGLIIFVMHLFVTDCAALNAPRR